VIRSAAVVAELERIGPEDLRLRVAPDADAADAPAEKDLSLGAAERKQIMRVMKLAAGNKRRASEMLGISRPTLDKKLRDHKIESRRFRKPSGDQASNSGR